MFAIFSAFIIGVLQTSFCIAFALLHPLHCSRVPVSFTLIALLSFSIDPSFVAPNIVGLLDIHHLAETFFLFFFFCAVCLCQSLPLGHLWDIFPITVPFVCIDQH
jgi:hypothetical protein